MKRCPLHNTWHPNEYRFCPDCGQELERNEVSSEDGDDGVFADYQKCADCNISLTSTDTAFATYRNKTVERLCNNCFDKHVNECIETRRLTRKEKGRNK